MSFLFGSPESVDVAVCGGFCNDDVVMIYGHLRSFAGIEVLSDLLIVYFSFNPFNVVIVIHWVVD